MPQTALFIEGASQIARDTWALLAERSLRSVELRTRGVDRVLTYLLEVTDTARLDAFVDCAAPELGSVDLLLVAVGDLGTSELDPLGARTVSRTTAANFVGPAATTAVFVGRLRARGSGRVVILFSAVFASERPTSPTAPPRQGSTASVAAWPTRSRTAVWG